MTGGSDETNPIIDPSRIRIADYDYPLPDSCIAQYPLKQRDASRLMVYRDQKASPDVFANITSHLPENGLLVFNNTRVIRARLIFHKSTGAPVEIFCLEPVAPTAELQSAFLQASGTTWKCLVGNLKRWKSGPLECTVSQGELNFRLTATRVAGYEDGTSGILFEWTPGDMFFGKVLEHAGLVPLPPYINRRPDAADTDRYQTIFAIADGSVAAPTAGLHFTDETLRLLRQKNIDQAQVTLHVGVGTFRPVNSERIGDHVMHHEKIQVTRGTLERLLEQAGRPVIAVGTTAARTLESLYWLGYDLISSGREKPRAVTQWVPYMQDSSADVPAHQALAALLAYLDRHHLEAYEGETQLMIAPGYRYRLVSGLITNFHMPQSTLLLLVAAMIGPAWREVYELAVASGFRFLSYGDACLFFNDPGAKNRNPAE